MSEGSGATNEANTNRAKRRKDRGAKKSGRAKRQQYTNVSIPRHLQPWAVQADHK